MAKQRESNIELLRIIGMFMIVSCHVVANYVDVYNLPFSINKLIASTFSSHGNLGVAIFVLISGYFLCESKTNIRKIIKLWFDAMFYTVISYLLSTGGVFSLVDFIKCFFPIGYSKYWFITAYAILIVLSPLLNIILGKLDKKGLLRFLIIATFFWSIIPFLFNIKYRLSYPAFFPILYMYAAYVRKYVTVNNNYKYNLMIALICYILTSLLIIGFLVAGHIMNDDVFGNHAQHFANLESPLVLLCAIELLIGFKKLKVKNNKIINIIASTTLDVYLCHYCSYVQNIIAVNVSKFAALYIDKSYFIIYALGITVLVYVSCSIVGFIKHNTIDKLFNKLLDKYIPNINKLLSMIYIKSCAVIDILIK